jgi:hypothetical protein
MKAGFCIIYSKHGKGLLMNCKSAHAVFASLRYLTSLWLILIMACGGSGGGGNTPAEATPELIWARQWGTSLNDRGAGVAVDSSGNVSSPLPTPDKEPDALTPALSSAFSLIPTDPRWCLSVDSDTR